MPERTILPESCNLHWFEYVSESGNRYGIVVTPQEYELLQDVNSPFYTKLRKIIADHEKFAASIDIKDAGIIMRNTVYKPSEFLPPNLRQPIGNFMTALEEQIYLREAVLFHDPDARNMVIQRNHNWLAKLVLKYVSPNSDVFDDLMQIARQTLNTAIDKIDLSTLNRLATYATPRILRDLLRAKYNIENPIQISGVLSENIAKVRLLIELYNDLNDQTLLKYVMTHTKLSPIMAEAAIDICRSQDNLHSLSRPWGETRSPLGEVICLPDQLVEDQVLQEISEVMIYELLQQSLQLGILSEDDYQIIVLKLGLCGDEPLSFCQIQTQYFLDKSESWVFKSYHRAMEKLRTFFIEKGIDSPNY